MSVLKLIASNGWGIYNKSIAKKIGLDEAIILGELASEYDYWLKQNELTVDGYFYSTVENIEKETSISEFKQRKALNKLKQLNMIDVQVKGLPAKRYIKINEKAVEDFLDGKINISRQIKGRIYIHRNKINGKYYVGQTINKPETRWMNGEGYKSQRGFYNDIVNYGWDNFEHIILPEIYTSQEELNAAEIATIAKYDSFNDGYNATIGGLGNRGYFTSYENEYEY